MVILRNLVSLLDLKKDVHKFSKSPIQTIKAKNAVILISCHIVAMVYILTELFAEGSDAPQFLGFAEHY